MGKMAGSEKIKALDEKLRKHLLETSISNRVSSTKLKVLTSYLAENRKQYAQLNDINKGRSISSRFSDSDGDLAIFNSIIRELEITNMSFAVMPGVIYFVDKDEDRISEKSVNQSFSLVTS